MKVGAFDVIRDFSTWTHCIFLIDDLYTDLEKNIRCFVYQVVSRKFFVYKFGLVCVNIRLTLGTNLLVMVANLEFRFGSWQGNPYPRWTRPIFQVGFFFFFQHIKFKWDNTIYQFFTNVINIILMLIPVCKLEWNISVPSRFDIAFLVYLFLFSFSFCVCIINIYIFFFWLDLGYT